MTGYQSKKAAAQDKLAQPEQEPVAWMNDMGTHILKLALEALEAAEIDGNCEYGATEIIRKALAQPEQRPWVGLTDEQISDIAINNPPMVHEFARAIEAAHGIKERNT